jgi:hypothetical protein
MKMDFVVGKIFENSYPPEAAIWCNNNNAYIKEISPKNNVRRFEIFRVDEEDIDQSPVIKNAYKEITEVDADWYIVSAGYKINSNKNSLDLINILISNFEDLKSTSTQIAFRMYDNKDELVDLDTLKQFKKDIELSFIDLKKQYWDMKANGKFTGFKHYGE